MSKIIKAQAGVAVKAIPIIAPALPAIGSVVSKVLPVIGGVPGVIASTLFDIATGGKSAHPGASQRNPESSFGVADATRVARPVVVPTRREINLHLGGTKALPVTSQSSTATPVMKKKKKARKARSTITRTPNAESTAVPVGSGTIAGSEDAAPRDTVRVTNGAAVENATPQDTANVQHGNAENTEQTTDDRNILQRLGDRWARRKAKNKKPKTENPPTNPPQENKGLVKRGFGYIKEHPLKSTLIGGPAVFLIGPKPFVGVWDVTSGIIKNRAKAWGFEEEDKNKTHNIGADKSTKSVQNDTTQAYNGFLINQQNLVE